MRTRWKTASELCQLYACIRALDDSRSAGVEVGAYDFSEPLPDFICTVTDQRHNMTAPLGIWELIQQASWLIGRCENLLRTLVEWEGRQFSDGMSPHSLQARILIWFSLESKKHPRSLSWQYIRSH